VHRLLAAEGLPVPGHLAFCANAPEEGAEFVERHGPCVVKPADGTGGGAGVTGGLRTKGDLMRAALKGSRWSDRLLVERQAPGLVYRLLLLEGELLDVVRRRPPCVTGDGSSTVMELIEAENERRLATKSLVGSLLRPDLDMMLALRAAGRSLDSVLPEGLTLPVKTITSQNGAADNETHRDPPAPELVEAARRAAEIVGLRLAGVDVVTPDPARPLDEAGGAIIEVNGHPGLTHHYEVADRAGATEVAVPILRRLLDGPDR
jgi:cyanophycin synthetase